MWDWFNKNSNSDRSQTPPWRRDFRDEPIPQIAFCPTGGVTPENARDYLALPNVICAGGSWVAPKDAVEAGDWARIETLARAAAALPR